jgi:hypothetical protein
VFKPPSILYLQLSLSPFSAGVSCVPARGGVCVVLCVWLCVGAAYMCRPLYILFNIVRVLHTPHTFLFLFLLLAAAVR